MFTCAVYVFGIRLAVFTLTWILADSPLALIDPEGGARDSQEDDDGITVVLQFNGQAQLPVPVNITFCGEGADPPCV
jgi:hypothetical protein